MNSNDLYCENERLRACYKPIKINSTVSKYFESCWMRIDPSMDSSIAFSTDPSLVQPEWSLIGEGVLYMFLSVAGVIMNFLIILAIIKSSTIRKEYLCPTIMSLAMSDFLFSIYVAPAISLRGFTKDLLIPQGCAFHFIVFHGLWDVSASSLLCMAVLRFFRLFFPAKSLTRAQNQWFQHASKIIPGICWVFAFLIQVPTLINEYGRFGLECKTFICIIVDVDKNGYQHSSHPYSLLHGIILLKGGFATILNVVTYFRVKRIAQKFNMGEKHLQQERKIGIMVMIITVSFVIVYCPLIVAVAVNQNVAVTNPNVASFCVVLANTLVIIDPIVIAMGQKKYKEEVRKVMENVYHLSGNITKYSNKTESNDEIELTNKSTLKESTNAF